MRALTELNLLQIDAKESKVVGFSCEKNVLELKFAKPEGPSFHYDPPTETTYGDQPLLGNIKQMFK